MGGGGRGLGISLLMGLRESGREAGGRKRGILTFQCRVLLNINCAASMVL